MRPGTILTAVASKIFPTDEEPVVAQPPTFCEAVEQARRDWLAARSYFEAVTDPDLVDHAIYVLEAAERKYMYLIKRAKAEGLTLSS